MSHCVDGKKNLFCFTRRLIALFAFSSFAPVYDVPAIRCLLFLPVILGVVYLSPQHSSEDHVSTFYFHLPSVNRVRLLTKPQIQ